MYYDPQLLAFTGSITNFEISNRAELFQLPLPYENTV